MTETLKDRASKAILKNLKDASKREPETYWSPIIVWLGLRNEDLEKEGLHADNEHGFKGYDINACFIYRHNRLLAHTAADERCHIQNVLEGLVEQGEIKRIFFWALGYTEKCPAYRVVMEKELS